MCDGTWSCCGAWSDHEGTFDAAIIANAQAVEHNEMARYGTIIAWAKTCGQDDVMKLMEETLAEKRNADKLLNDMASKEINQKTLKQAA